MKNIILSKGGTNERTVEVSQIIIPDLWNIAHLPELDGYTLGGKSATDLILECWHLAHDLKRALSED